MRRLASTCLLLAALPGCTHLAIWAFAPERIEECDGPIVAISAGMPDFTERLRVQVESPNASAVYQVVLQKRGDRLIVIALTRFGAKAFSVVRNRGRQNLFSHVVDAALLSVNTRLTSHFVVVLGGMLRQQIRKQVFIALFAATHCEVGAGINTFPGFY